jgi:hypothetical protein
MMNLDVRRGVFLKNPINVGGLKLAISVTIIGENQPY